MAENGISTLATKELRQIAKLDLAAAKRNQSYNIDLLTTKYDGNDVINNPNVGGLQPGRPWISGPPAPTGNDFGFTGDQNSWTINGGMNAGSTFSSPPPSNPAYTYPDGSYTGKTYNFDGTTWMSSMNLAINEAWQTNAITIDLWFYPTANDVQLMSECGQPDVTSGYHYSMLEIASDGRVHAKFYNSQYPGSAIVSTNTVDLNQWNHIWFQETAAGAHNFTLNNVSPNTNSTYTRLKPETGEYFLIGLSDSSNIGRTERFQGKIGYLNIYDYAHASTWTDTNARFRPAPTYTLTSDASIDEGGGLTFTASGTNVPDGEYYWTIETGSGDFTVTSGSLGVSNNYGSFIVVPDADATTEGNETFTVALRSGSVSGPIVVTSAAITINDTSLGAFSNPDLTLTGVSGATTSPFSGGGNSYYFANSPSTIVAPGSDRWALGTGDFTIEWFQYETDSNSFPRIFHRGAAYPNQEIGVSIEGGTFYAWVKSATAVGSATPYKNAWVHFAVVRSGTSLSVYKNGTQLGSTTSNSTNFADTSSVLTIGRETNGIAGTQYGGYITNFRWVKGLAVYTGDFTVPTSALTATANANPYGGSNTVAIPAGVTKLLLVPIVHTATQSAANGGSNGIHIDTNPTNDAWAGTVPVGAKIVADGYGTFTVTSIYAPTDPGNLSANWFFVVSPNTSYFNAGTALTFIWTV